MSVELLAFASAFALVLAVELPDKTLVATLVLTTRYSGRDVLAGVAIAFAAHVTIAALFASAITALPESLTSAIAAALFAVGAVLLLREGFARAADGLEDASRQGAAPTPFLRAALTSFGVLFAAELGDASQLATVGLAARFGEPVAVALGSFTALMVVACVAVLIGGKVRTRIQPRWLQRISGTTFAAFAALATAHAFA